MDNMVIAFIEISIKYFIIGCLSGYLLVYGLRPSIPYPDFILDTFEHLWLFLILIIVNYYAYIWDLRIGYLLTISIVALIIDLQLFTNIKKNIK